MFACPSPPSAAQQPGCLCVCTPTLLVPACGIPCIGVFRQSERVGLSSLECMYGISTLCTPLPYPMHALRKPEAKYSMQTAEGSMHVDCSTRYWLGRSLVCGYNATAAHQWTCSLVLHSAKKSQRAKCLSIATTCCLPSSAVPASSNKQSG